MAWRRVLSALNTEQKKHVAKTLNTIGLGQLAAFGYASLSNGSWWVMLVSGIILFVFERLALAVLADLKER